MTEILSSDEFAVLADRLQVPDEVREELYPMVRDLRSLADRLNQLVPELHSGISEGALSSAVSEGDR